MAPLLGFIVSEATEENCEVCQRIKFCKGLWTAVVRDADPNRGSMVNVRAVGFGCAKVDLYGLRR